MNGYEGLIVWCVIFIPLSVFLLVGSWKNWHGEWLVLSNFSYVPGKGSEALQRRRGRRTALLNLVFVAYAVGMLGSSALSDMAGASASTTLWAGTAMAVLAGGGVWIGVASRRDAEALARAAAGEGPELPNYRLDARGIAVLVMVILAVLAVEIGGTLVA